MHPSSPNMPASPGFPSGSPSPAASPIPDRPSSPELPLTMSASALLTALPRDASAALARAGEFTQEKVIVRFTAIGNAPALRQQVCKISASQKFEAVVAYLRRVLRVKDTDSVFLYVNNAFAPSLDEIVGNLHRVSFIFICICRIDII
jgi:ubiquitin-like protein ATG12